MKDISEYILDAEQEARDAAEEAQKPVLVACYAETGNTSDPYCGCEDCNELEEEGRQRMIESGYAL